MENIVLILDTDTVELRKLREIFAREGYSIMTAADRSTAMQILSKVRVRYVVGAASMFTLNLK